MDISGQDRYIIEGLAKQEKSIIENIYKLYFEMIVRFVQKNKGSFDDAADLFQEAMIVIYQKSLDSNFVLNCQFKTYLYSVCRRLWLKKLQRDQKAGILVEELETVVAVETDMEAHLENQLNFQMMDKALNEIGEPCKSLLNAYYIQRKNMQEIATDFKYTNADNAKTQKYKCLMRLKKIFFSEYKNKS